MFVGPNKHFSIVIDEFDGKIVKAWHIENSKGEKSVTIRRGDTLSEIAARNGTTVKKLRKLNKISGNSIRAGKKLKVK